MRRTQADYQWHGGRAEFVGMDAGNALSTASLKPLGWKRDAKGMDDQAGSE